MLAIQPPASRPRRTKTSTRGSAPGPRAAGQAKRSSRLPAFASPPSVDLAGRAVALGRDVPREFDAPLAPHHKLIGRWVAGRETAAPPMTRPEARKHIERVFGDAVLEILKPVDMAQFRVVALAGDEALTPALALICDTVGAIELGWIETSNALSNSLRGPVAPMMWQATAYKALCEALPRVLPIFGYAELFEHIAAYYWEDETTDVEAVKSMVQWHGADPDEIDEEMLPSAMNARRPAWMIATNAGPLKHLPVKLADRIRRLRIAAAAVERKPNAWRYDHETACSYVPEYEDCSTLPPVTLVPPDPFARELDDAGRSGMETGWMDIAGLCQPADAAAVDNWFSDLKLRVEVLLAAQDLIACDPTKP